MSDLISRQAAIDAIFKTCRRTCALSHALEKVLEKLPSEQPDTDEWCHDCKEYDQEHHCCPRWNRVIKTTLAEAQQGRTEMSSANWIPCSERLPSKADHIDNMVLVCYGNGSVRFNTYMNGWVQGNPVAWMPLPEPYKGE